MSSARTDETSTKPSGWTAWRIARWSALLVTVFAVGIGAVFGAQLGKDPTLVDSPLIGKPGPGQRVPELEGPGSLSLDDLRGQIVVVNFWASWCVPCREEHSVLTSAATNYRQSGVTFVGVNYQDRRNSAISFLDELGRGDGYRYVTDPASKLALEFGVFGVPETFFLDQNGKIVGKITGPTSYPVLSAALDEMLAGRQPGTRVEGSVQPGPGP